MGLFSVLGNATGFIVGSLARADRRFEVGTVMLGVIELVTMLAVVIGVDEGRAAKARKGRSWLTIAADAWGTDVLRERSFVFLVGSRLFVLMGWLGAGAPRAPVPQPEPRPGPDGRG